MTSEEQLELWVQGESVQAARAVAEAARAVAAPLDLAALARKAMET